MLLDPAALLDWPTDGICWLELVIADHRCWDPPLVVSASLLTLIFSLVIAVLLLQRYSSFNNRAMDDTEMAVMSSNAQLAPSTSCKPLCNGAAETCSLMDVDVEEEEKGQVSVESCRERPVGMPFPGSLLADGTFVVEYHNM